jgi:methylglutaconyl-CoA hydratase
MPTTLNISITRRVGLVSMARPQVRNAFNETTIAELTDAFRTLGADPGLRAVVLAGEGPAFCAGADLDWMRRMSQYSRDENLADATRLATMLRTIYECPKPVIARVHGAAFAGGVGLVAACDVAVASQTAEFCLTETKLGLIPATIAPYVIRAMGPGNARRYFLTAEKFDSGAALRMGLVQDVVAADRLDATIDELLGALMLTSAEAVTEAKRLVRDLAFRPIDDALVADTAERITAIRQSADGREGIASFLEKRKPRWVAEHEAMEADGDDEEM